MDESFDAMRLEMAELVRRAREVLRRIRRTESLQPGAVYMNADQPDDSSHDPDSPMPEHGRPSH